MIFIKKINTFWFISIDVNQNIAQLRTPLKTRSFCPHWCTLKNLDLKKKFPCNHVKFFGEITSHQLNLVSCKNAKNAIHMILLKNPFRTHHKLMKWLIQQNPNCITHKKIIFYVKGYFPIWCIKTIKSFLEKNWFNGMNHRCIGKMGFIMIFFRLPNTFSWSIGMTNNQVGFWRRDLLGTKRLEWNNGNFRLAMKPKYWLLTGWWLSTGWRRNGCWLCKKDCRSFCRMY
jgi:hypothetical protein